MQQLFIRTPRNCALVFNAFIAVFLIRLVAVLALGYFLHGLFVVALPLLIVLMALLGLLAFQIGYHPMACALWCGALLIPMVGFVAMLLVFFQSKKFLKENGYKIVLLGARPALREDVIAEMDALLQTGEIRGPDDPATD